MAEEYNKWIEEHGGNLVFIWLMGLFVATVSCYAADVWFELATLARVILVLTCIWVFGFFGVVTFLVPQILSCIDRKREGRSDCPDHSIFIFFWILGFIILVPTFIFFHCRLTRNLLILWGVLYWIIVEIFWAIFGKEEKIEWDEEGEDKKPAEFHASETCTMEYPNVQKASDPIRSLLGRCDNIAESRQLIKILDLIDQYEIKTPSGWKTQYLSLLKESLETYLGTSWRELPADEHRKIQEDMKRIVSATLKQGQDIIHTYYQEKGTNLAVNRDVLEALAAPDAFTDKHNKN